ncbi:uncharacterized protein LOC122502051 [Leptopilina heterotoma]|uniref:uncharacterized protein LOC122502051 n=1 Tax=Leptopilina heterotoma TaxID=63436 RepID=UPI001CA84DBE|nr:uncharacterized protein LOC122502051 [Leptopilina heterotoma]
MEGDAKRPTELSDSGNLATNWNLWKKEFQTYMKITKGVKKPEDEQVAWLKNFIGPVGLKAFEQLSFDNPRDEENMIIVMEKLNQFFLYTKNQKVQRYKFFSKVRKDNESIDEYAKDLQEMAKSCNFGDQSKLLILDAIILSIKDEKLRNLLFEEPDLTLNKLKNIYKTYVSGKQETANKNESSTTFFKKECSKCGQRHAFKNCPAFGKNCHYCKQANHFTPFCPVLKAKQETIHTPINTQNNDEQFSSSTNIRASTSLDRSQNEFRTQPPVRKSTEKPSAQTKNNTIPPSYNSLYPDSSPRAPPAPAPRKNRQHVARYEYVYVDSKNSNVKPRYREKQKSQDDADCTIQ